MYRVMYRWQQSRKHDSVRDGLGRVNDVYQGDWASAKQQKLVSSPLHSYYHGRPEYVYSWCL